MAIDRDVLYADTVLYLPEGNVLTEGQIRTINEQVIALDGIEDDNAFYSEVLCKSLKRCALINAAKYDVDGAGLRRDKVGEVELEFHEKVSPYTWRKYIRGLSQLCPFLPGGGYSPAYGMGIQISPGCFPDVNPPPVNATYPEGTVTCTYDSACTCPGCLVL